MGWIFKRRAKPSACAGQEAQLSAQAQKIADGIIQVQRSLAAKLNAQAEKIGLVNTKLLLGAVLLGFAGYCAWLVLTAVILR